MNTHFFKKLICLGMIFSLTFIGLSGCGQKKTELVNVSYDATREFYKEYNRLFEDYWYGRTGEKVEVIQSHGGSGKQAQRLISVSLSRAWLNVPKSSRQLPCAA